MKFERYLSYVLIFVMACVVSIGCNQMQKPVMDAMNGGMTDGDGMTDPEMEGDGNGMTNPEMEGDGDGMTDPEMETPITYPEPVKENLFYQVETVEHIINSQVYKDFLAAPCRRENGRERTLPLEFSTYEEAERMIAYLNEAEDVWTLSLRPSSSELYQYFNATTVRRVCE